MPSIARVRPDLVPVTQNKLSKLIHEELIFRQIAIETPMPEKAGTYPHLEKGEIMRLEDTKRAPRTGFGRSDYKTVDKSYDTEGYGWEEPVDDVERKAYGSQFNIDTIGSVRATRILLTSFEKKVAKEAQNETKAGTKIICAKTWKDRTADIRKDINDAKEQMGNKYAIQPSVLVIPEPLVRYMTENEELSEKMKFTTPLELMPKAQRLASLATYLDVDKVLVGTSRIRTQSSNKEKEAWTPLWEPNVVSLLKPIDDGSIDLLEEGFMRNFVWSAMGGLYRIEDYRDEPIKSDVYRAEGHIDPRVVSYQALGIITGVYDDVTTP